MRGGVVMSDFRFFRQYETLFWKPAGEPLFEEGSPPNGVWLLHSGSVDLLFSNSRGDIAPLRVVETPQTLGISEVLGEGVFDCSAIAHTPCLVGFIDKETFLSIVMEDSDSRIAMLQIESDELTSCYDCMRMIGLQTTTRSAQRRGGLAKTATGLRSQPVGRRVSHSHSGD